MPIPVTIPIFPKIPWIFRLPIRPAEPFSSRLIDRANGIKSDTLISLTDGIALKKNKRGWDVVYFTDLAPTVPYQIDSRHSFTSAGLEPRPDASKLKKLIQFVRQATSRGGREWTA